MNFKAPNIHETITFVDKEPPRKVIIGRSGGNNNGSGSNKGGDDKPPLGLEKKSIYSRLGGKALDGLENKREKVSHFFFIQIKYFFQNFSQFVVFYFF